MFYTIIFLDTEGNELYRKHNDFQDEIEARKYALLIIANGRHDELDYELHQGEY